MYTHIVRRVGLLGWLLYGLFATGVSAADVFAADTSVDEPPLVLVTGATGRLGRYLIEDLRAADFIVRGITRDPEKALAEFGDQYQWISANLNDPAALSDALKGVDYVIYAAGGTAPSGPNSPRIVDYEGARAVIDASVATGIEQFVLVSSIGVTQRFHLLNLTFGNVLTWKWEAEQHLRASGLDYSIVRPGGLRPGPAGIEGLSIRQGDAKGGSYIYLPDAAQLIVTTVGNPDAINKTFEALSDPDQAADAWRGEFTQLEKDAGK